MFPGIFLYGRRRKFFFPESSLDHSKGISRLCGASQLSMGSPGSHFGHVAWPTCQILLCYCAVGFIIPTPFCIYMSTYIVHVKIYLYIYRIHHIYRILNVVRLWWIRPNSNKIYRSPPAEWHHWLDDQFLLSNPKRVHLNFLYLMGIRS